MFCGDTDRVGTEDGPADEIEIAVLKKKLAELEAKAAPEKKILTTTDDVDNLLSCLFTVSTLLIGFMTTFIGQQNYDYLVATDQRWQGAWSKWDHSWFAGASDKVFLFSALLGFRSMTALTLLVIALILAIATLIGFNYSNCREDAAVFQAWLSVFKYVIGAAYILFLAGTIYSMSSIVLAGFGNYPKYCDVNLTIFGAWGDPDKVVGANGNLVEGCIQDAMDLNQGAKNVVAINILAPVLVVTALAVSIYIKPLTEFTDKLRAAVSRK